MDVHIHHSAAMSAKHLLDFMKQKMKNEKDTIINEDGQTLRDLLEWLQIDPDHLTLNSIDVMADKNTFKRFDRFN